MSSPLQLKDFSAIKISLASPAKILEWSFGEIKKPETINYRTFKCEKDGLFCERIFGPTKDFECYCGKYKRIRYMGVVCDKCGVEVTYARVRRERMGHIKLCTPVAHPWFYRGVPSKMATLLNLSPRSLESVIYFSSYIVLSVDEDAKTTVISGLEKELYEERKTMRDEVEEKAAELLEKSKEEIKALKIADKTARDLTGEEMMLKAKREISAIRDDLVVRQEELEKHYDLLKQKLDGIRLHTVLSDMDYLDLSDYVGQFAEVSIGAEAIGKLLSALDLDLLAAALREEIIDAKGQKLVKLTKRIRAVEGFRRSKIRPEWMIISVLPVIPPDLRPMVQLEGGRFATSDLNDLYRRVLNRNNRLKHLLDLGAPEIIIRNEKRMLQTAVDALIDTSEHQARSPLAAKQELRSLSDMLKGKQGRFRQNLLGKRVDYSGRSVIVVGPDLKLNQCGIPKEMALELFKPFVLRDVMLRGLAPNVKSAKYIVDQRGPEIWDILEELVKKYPVLLNRAPTLHRLGVQAFYARLVDGNAIQLHPCVCAGFNADFDGDQMAVHLPLSDNSVKECNELMLSSVNLLKPADGSPIDRPSSDMVAGTYYLTNIDERLEKPKSVFATEDEVLLALGLNKVSIRQPIDAVINGKIVETTPGRVVFNKILPDSLRFFNDETNKKNGAIKNLIVKCLETEGNERTVKLIDDLMGIGFEYATHFAISMSIFDAKVSDKKAGVIAESREKVALIDDNFKKGLITKQEMKRLSEEVWIKATEDVDELTWNGLETENPIRAFVVSGCRGDRDQVKQIAGIKGLVTDPTGRVVELPTLSNYREGLSVFEYFSGSRGARKGLTDKALKTADAGYLTRRLVDVAQDMIIREDDCGTTEGRVISAKDTLILSTLSDRIRGRVLAKDVKSGKKVIVKAGELITDELAKKIEEAKVKTVTIRSALNCRSRYGICAKCYGVDLATNKMVVMGTPVGVAAAQSIGEPGTQLTLRTFHFGGVIGRDITQGLPRVEEVFEARTPKNLSLMSEISGQVKVYDSKGDRRIVITALEKDADPHEVTYEIDPISEILVTTGDLVSAGDRLTHGYLDLSELLATVGVADTEKYIINEVQQVYSSQGVTLNDKHLEVIVRQMFSKVRIVDQGDTQFLKDEVVSAPRFQGENEIVLAQGGNPATAEVILLGITRASLETDSFLAAASFQETSRVLTEAAVSGKVDKLMGLKENVIIGRLIPVGERARIRKV